MKLKRCLNQVMSGDCSSSHRISSVTDTRDEVSSVPDEIAASLGGQVTQDEILPLPGSDRPVYESSDLPPVADFSWGDLDGDAFGKMVGDCYDEGVHWKRNIFLIPSGGAGKAFVDEVARLFQAYADNDAIEPIALKACMVMQICCCRSLESKVKLRNTLRPWTED